MTTSVDLGADPNAEKAPPGPKIWGFWLTLAWALGAIAVWVIAQIVVVIVLIAQMRGAEPGEIARYLRQIASNGPAVSWTLLGSMPFLVGFLALATRCARTPFGDYLALKWPSWRQVLLGFIALAAVLGLAELAASFVGVDTPSFMVDTLRTAEESGSLPLFALAFVLVAPFSEEILFRGFLFPGFVKSLGPLPAIALTAILWASLHVQYQLFFIGEIVALGVLLGTIRWLTGSTLLTFLLHATNNGAALILLALDKT